MTPDDNGIERAPRDPERQLASGIYNWLSMVGAALAVIGATIAGFFLVGDLLTEEVSGYAGLALLPPIGLALLGVVLFVAGWLREIRRQRRGERSRFVQRWVVDPMRIVQRTGPWVLLLVLFAATVGFLSLGSASVGVVEFSESNTFCSNSCHQVMGPEATVYHATAHSRVDCVRCHVGAGAEGFMAAKIGGVRQLWHVVTNSVHPPIETPIESPVIGRKLCEGCHSPTREVGYKILTRHYYLNGLEDTPIELAMVVKVGGSKNGLIPEGGIHYHMVNARTVDFIARDRQRQDIAWIRVEEPDGSLREYDSLSAPLSPEEKSSLPVHRMDCIDCHSRPAHAFRSPVDVVDGALQSGQLPSDIYYIKEASVRALDGGYASEEAAMSGIEASFRDYFEQEDPSVLEDRADEVTSAIEVLRGLYRKTIFPGMKVDWKTHPNNIGHRYSPGCFRCHNDDMVGGDGKPIFADCTRCHAILAEDQEAIKTAGDLDRGMGFSHPQDGEFILNFKLCSKCHTGGKELYE